MFYLVIVAVILCILFKILNVNNSAEKSIFYCKNQKFLEEFLKRAPELELPYVPTRFWGFSGHIQTIIQVCIHPEYSCYHSTSREMSRKECYHLCVDMIELVTKDVSQISLHCEIRSAVM